MPQHPRLSFRPTGLQTASAGIHYSTATRSFRWPVVTGSRLARARRSRARLARMTARTGGEHTVLVAPLCIDVIDTHVQSATIMSNKVPAPLRPHSTNAMTPSTTATAPVDHSSQ
jgi:hypothetical protein